jgi:hypothetical protein
LVTPDRPNGFATIDDRRLEQGALIVKFDGRMLVRVTSLDDAKHALQLQITGERAARPSPCLPAPSTRTSPSQTWACSARSR